jgi:hypothetical protein
LFSFAGNLEQLTAVAEEVIDLGVHAPIFKSLKVAR